MIIGIGCDLCNIARIEKILTKHHDMLTKRIFSTKEIQHYKSKNLQTIQQKAAYIAKRFAAKEACAKAIGTGFAQGIFWKDIQIINNNLGKPELNIEGSSLDVLQKHYTVQAFNFHLSLSDDYPWAQAFVVIETN